MLGKVTSWFHGTKIYSYFERRKEFKRALFRVKVSLTFTPANWRCHYPFVMENDLDKMRVWIGNSYYGIDFDFEGKRYGNPNHWGDIVGNWTWRAELYRLAQTTAHKHCVEKYGYEWDRRNEK